MTWEMDIWAESPEDAARKARAIQLDQNSDAVVFGVVEESGDAHSIDLHAEA